MRSCGNQMKGKLLGDEKDRHPKFLDSSLCGFSNGLRPQFSDLLVVSESLPCPSKPKHFLQAAASVKRCSKPEVTGLI